MSDGLVDGDIRLDLRNLRTPLGRRDYSSNLYWQISVARIEMRSLARDGGLCPADRIDPRRRMTIAVSRPTRVNPHRRRRMPPIRQLLAGRIVQYWHFRELPSVDSYSLRCPCIYCCTICRQARKSLASSSSWCATKGGWTRRDTFCWSVESSDYLHYLLLMDYLQSLGSVTLNA